MTAACFVGVALRTWPLWQSPLPFNPDGIMYARSVRETLESGSFPLAEMATDELAFTALLATVSQVTGVDALYHSQGVAAVVGSVPVILVAAIARRIAGGVGLDGQATRYAVVLGAWTLAVEGLYLHRSMPVDEQTVGLFLVPLGVLAVVYAVGRDRRWWAVALPVLAALPSVHNLDAFVTALALTLLALVALESDRLAAPRIHLAVALAYWTWVVGYTIGIDALTAATVIQQARLTAVPDLVLAWLILTALGVAWFLGRSARTKRVLLSTVLFGWFVVLAANALTPIFPGLPATHPLILYGIAPLVVLVALFALALPDALTTNDGLAVFAVLAGVVVLVGVSLTASLTAEYLNTLYRVQTFAHLPVVAVAAVGAARLLASRRPGWLSHFDARTAAAALTAIVLLGSVASIPIAYSGLDVLTYKGVTEPAELQSSGFAVEYTTGNWTSDDHLTRIQRYYDQGSQGRVQPTYEYLTGSEPPQCPILTQSSWTTVGGQLYPRSAATIPPPRYERLLTKTNVVYDTGTTDRIALMVPATRSENGC